MKKFTALSARREVFIDVLEFVEHKKRAGGDQREAGALAPGQRLLEIGVGKPGEHQKRDDFLDGLELRRIIDGVAEAIGRNR